MRNPNELCRAVEFMARKTNPNGAIVVLLDADDDCPAQLGPELLNHAQSVRSDRAISVVVASREYESWLIAGASGLGGYRGLPPDLKCPLNVDAIRDAKGWLNERMKNGYHETTEQPKLSSRFNIEDARRSDSFDKLCREVISLLAASSTGR